MTQSAYTIAGMQTGTTVIRDIRSNRISPQLQELLLGGSGGAFDTFVAVGKLMPIMDFVTGDLKTMLAAMTSQIALAIDNNFSIWFQKIAEGGLRSAGSTHTKGDIAKGMVIPVSLRLTGNPIGAELACRIIMTSTDGLTSPLALTGSQALVANAQAGAGWALGPVSINGTALEGVEEVAIEFGITEMTMPNSGLPYPSFTSVGKVRPRVRITAAGIDEFLSWGLAGVAQGATDSTIQIDDVVEGGLRGEAPIVCSIDEGMIHTDTLDQQDGNADRHSIIIVPTFDGTALPLAWSGLT